MPAWTWVGERALLRRFDGAISSANRSAHAVNQELTARTLGEIEDMVPGARTLLVVLRPGAAPSAELIAVLEGEPPASPRWSPPLVEIPVSYGGEDGPDLGDVAAQHGMDPEAVVRAHSAASYIVGFLGFSPGFPYLLGLPPELATPRLDTPRTRVPAGSVGIGGTYTGIYPNATPGGWRLIGRTDAALFDPARKPPAVLKPGTPVRFVAR